MALFSLYTIIDLLRIGLIPDYIPNQRHVKVAKKLPKRYKSAIRQLEKKANKLEKKQYAVAERLDTVSAKARRKLEKIDARRDKVLRRIAVLTGVTESKRDDQETLAIDRRLFANAPWADLPLGLLFGKQR